MSNTISADIKQWYYFPVEMPLTKDGDGPAKVGSTADVMTYEVWDQTYETHGSFDNLYDAINLAMELEIKGRQMNNTDIPINQVQSFLETTNNEME